MFERGGGRQEPEVWYLKGILTELLAPPFTRFDRLLNPLPQINWKLTGSFCPSLYGKGSRSGIWSGPHWSGRKPMRNHLSKAPETATTNLLRVRAALLLRHGTVDVFEVADEGPPDVVHGRHIPQTPAFDLPPTVCL